MHEMMMELLPLCLPPVGVAHKFALSSQISDAGGTAMTSVTQSDEFLAEEEEETCGIFCQVEIQLQTAVALTMAWHCSCSAQRCQLPDLFLSCEETNCLVNEIRCARLC